MILIIELTSCPSAPGEEGLPFLPDDPAMRSAFAAKSP